MCRRKHILAGRYNSLADRDAWVAHETAYGKAYSHNLNVCRSVTALVHRSSEDLWAGRILDMVQVLQD